MTAPTLERSTGAENIIWDLSVFYTGLQDERIPQDMETVTHLAEDFAHRYKGQVAKLTATEMVVAMQALEAIYEIRGRLSTYASLNFSTASHQAEWGAFLQKVIEHASQIGQKLVFFMLEWNQLSDEAAQAILDAAELGDYRYPLFDQRRFKPHQLSEPEERIALEKDVVGRNAWSRFFNQMTSNMLFEYEGDHLPMPKVLNKLYDTNREIRHKAADSLTSGLKTRSLELTYIFNTILADRASEDKLRGYPSWIRYRNLLNASTDQIVESLIQTVTANYELVARHYRLKRALLGYEELYDYDRYAPLGLKESDDFYTWDRARETVLAAFGGFSPHMAEVASQFFAQNWIHAPIQHGKRGGAYASYGTKDTHPFVFMNFSGSGRDLMTLAHELGHGIHMYLARDAQNRFNMTTPLTTAEMASTFCETVVFQDMMAREADDEVRLGMLVKRVEDSFATIFRQVSMNRFEDALHTTRRTSGELSTEHMSRLWLETQRAMFQGSVTLREDYGMWWSYVGHFISTPGYVYAYAFGELLVLALYQLYQGRGESFIPQYEALLAAGGSDDPDKLLARVGVDLNDPQFWERGIAVLRGMIEQEEALAKQLYPHKF